MYYRVITYLSHLLVCHTFVPTHTSLSRDIIGQIKSNYSANTTPLLHTWEIPKIPLPRAHVRVRVQIEPDKSNSF